jgi:hypothetical protein
VYALPLNRDAISRQGFVIPALDSHATILFSALLTFPLNIFVPVCAACPVHLIFLDFIILSILDEEQKSRISSVCSFVLGRYESE